MKYTDEEIIRNSELAESLGNCLPFAKEANGKYSADKLGNLGPVILPCRRVAAELMVFTFDKPDDLVVIPDETPNGKRIGTKMIAHKKWESFIRRHNELTVEVFKDHGFIIGDANNDKFISFGKMRDMQAEVHRRHKLEYGDAYPF